MTHNNHTPRTSKASRATQVGERAAANTDIPDHWLHDVSSLLLCDLQALVCGPHDEDSRRIVAQSVLHEPDRLRGVLRRKAKRTERMLSTHRFWTHAHSSSTASHQPQVHAHNRSSEGRRHARKTLHPGGSSGGTSPTHFPSLMCHVRGVNGSIKVPSFPCQARKGHA